MKSAIVFFLSLCFLILGKHDQTFAKPANTQSIQKANQLLSKNIADNVFSVKKSTVPEKKEELISVENEDEDLALSKKNQQISRSFPLPGLFIIVQNRPDHLVRPLPFCKHFSYTSSCKYILQRVLRI